MKTIICFIGALGSGGAEHQMNILSSLLSERGYAVKLVTFLDIPDFYQEPSAVCRIRLAQNKSKLQKLFAIFSFFLRVKADCVISYTQRANLLCIIPLLFRRHIKVIASERNISRGKQTARERALFRFFYKRADYIVPNSMSQASYIASKRPQLTNKIVPINNYTDLNLFRITPLPLNDEIRIAVFARFQRQKNCLRFVDALTRLIKDTPRKFVVDWYGRREFDNPSLQEYYNTFERKIINGGLENYLFVKDPIKDVSKRIEQYDAICLPSVLEGFSNSIAEGIASGRPMLVSDISDNSVMVRHLDNGVLFDPYDIDSMCEAFRLFLSLPNNELERMGKRSKE